MPSPTEISSIQLARLIGTPTAPVIIDVRIDDDFSADPQIIPGAFRHSYDNVESLIPKLKDKSVVIYYQKGKKLSQRSAAILRDQGIITETLQGRHFAWRDSSLPLVDSPIYRSLCTVLIC